MENNVKVERIRSICVIRIHDLKKLSNENAAKDDVMKMYIAGQLLAYENILKVIKS